MKQAALLRPASRLVSECCAVKAVFASANENAAYLAGGTLRSSRGFAAFVRQDFDALLKGSVFSPAAQSCAALSGRLPEFPGKNFARTYVDAAERRRRMNAYRMENADSEEEAKNIDMDPKKMLEKGSPGTYQAIIKDVMPVGYFVTMPSGREGYLPALDLNFTGGLAILERLFKVGQEITVRITGTGGGRDILSLKKPEFAVDPDKFRIGASGLRNRSENR